MNFRPWLSIAGFIALAFVPLLRAAEVAGDLVFSIDVLGGLTPSGVHDAVKAAAVGRGYTIKEDKPDHLIFDLTLRGHEAHLAAVFDAKSVRLYSDSYELDRSGAREEKEVPHDWVKYLHEDFTENLNRVAALKK